MNCPHFEQVAEVYLSGEIESPQWCTHLQNCLECAAELRAELNFDLIIKHAVSEERLQTRQLESHIRSTIRKSSRATLCALSSVKIRTLVVDDHEQWRRFALAALLTDNDFHILGQAVNGVEAVQQAQELQPDLILLDIGLPEMNGIEAARRIRQLSPNSKILFVSMETNLEIVKTALQAGADGYICKADAGSQLFDAIRAILENKQFVSSSLVLGTIGFKS